MLIVMHYRAAPEQIRRVVDTIGSMGYRARFLRSRAGRATVADPGHGTGVREKVVPMAGAAGTAA